MILPSFSTLGKRLNTIVDKKHIVPRTKKETDFGLRRKKGNAKAIDASTNHLEAMVIDIPPTMISGDSNEVEYIHDVSRIIGKRQLRRAWTAIENETPILFRTVLRNEKVIPRAK